MGYESKLYIVDKTGVATDKDNKRWAEVIATFDLCRTNIDFSKFSPTDCYFYDGDERVVEDCYGDPIKEISISDMIELIENAMARDDYRRWQPCLGLLKGFTESQWTNLVVLHYGH